MGIQLGLARSGYSFRTPEEQYEALEGIVEDAEKTGDLGLIAQVHLLIALGRLQNGDPPTAPLVKRSLDRISAAAEALGDPSLRATPLALIGMSEVFSGSSVRAGVASLEEAVPLLERTHDSIGAAFARGALAMGYAMLGDFDKAEIATVRANELAEKGDLIAQLDAQIAESMVRAAMGQLDRAVPIARECIDRAEATGASACVVASSWVLGDAFHRQGKFAEARDILKRGSDVSYLLDRRVWRPTLQAWLGSAMAALGEVGDDQLDEALEVARGIGNKIGEAGILGKRAEITAARGDIEGARPDFEASLAIAEELGLRPSKARALRTWAEALQTAGRRDEAAEHYREALAVFEELKLEPEASAIRTVLAAGGTKIAFS